jgi:TolA-binding protein
MMTGFNLLRFPTLERQQREKRRWRSGWMGAGVGAVLAGGWMQWQSWQTDHLHQTLQGLQIQLAERQRQTQSQRQQAQQNQMQREQWAQLDRLQTQQQAWTLLQGSVLEEAQIQGLVLQRLQVDAGRIDIQGHAPTVQAMTRALQRLSERWGQPLHLSSLETFASGDFASTGVSFSWQGTWPALGDKATQQGQAKP